MTVLSQKTQIIIGTLFFVVGSIAVFDTVQTNHYIFRAARRDEAQEQCQLRTIESLENFQQARLRFDEQLRPMLTELALSNGQSIQPDTATRVLAALNDYDAAIRGNPPPNCDLGKK